MSPNREQSPARQILSFYEPIVKAKYENYFGAWPILSGYNVITSGYKDWLIIIFKHTGSKGIVNSSGIGAISEQVLGVSEIDIHNKGSVRKRLEKHFSLKLTDAVIFINQKSGIIEDELQIMFKKHEHAMGLTPMKVFLSHKGADKPLVREYKKTLELLGFDPWLDEDSMHAGAELERSLLKGFNDSCAAVFFVTPNYLDENFLASEIDYAMQEKRKKGDKFSIITLVLGEGDSKGAVPDLLHRYVWKEPKNDLEGIREILKALPIKVGDTYWEN